MMNRLVLALLGFISIVNAFTGNVVFSTRQVSTLASPTRLNFFGKPKDDGSPGDYKCPDCDYVFTGGPEAWKKLDDNWRCPPCGAPKFRFKKVPKGSATKTGGAAKKEAPKKKGWF